MNLSISKNLDIKIVIIAIIAVIIFAIVLIFGYNAYPVPSGDSVHFLPGVINFSLGNGLVNQVSNLVSEIDKSGFQKQIIYPPLFALFSGYFIKILHIQNSAGILFAISIFNGLSVVLATFIFYKILSIDKKYKNDFLLLIVIGLLAFATTLDIHQSRPESLARLFFLLMIISAIYIKPKKLWLLFGLLLGLMAGTQLVVSIGVALLMGMFFAVRFDWKNALKAIFLTGLLSIIVLLAILLLSPLGFWENINGIFSHFLKIIHTPTDISPLNSNGIFWKIFIIKYYFLLPGTTFFGFIMVLSAIFGAKIYFIHKKNIKSQILFLLFFILFLVYFYPALRSSQYYNILFFSVIFIGIIIYYIYTIEKNNLIKIASLLMILSVSFGFLRDIVLFPYFLKDGVSLEKARTQFENLKDNDNKIGITTGLWTLSENYKDIYIYIYMKRWG